ncbi:MAG: sulfotransferase [bacterium]|nr:sulfotransferase [bacterium]
MIWSIGKKGGGPSDQRTADEATPKIRASILQACQKLVEDAGGGRYVDDLSYHSLSLPFLRAVVPGARILRCTRDAQDVIPEIAYSWKRKPSLIRVASHRRTNFVWSSLPKLGWRFAKRYFAERVARSSSTWGPRVPGLAEFNAANGPVLSAAYQWSQMMEIFRHDLENFPSDQVLSIRYEDLFENLDRECDRIASFCEVEDIASLKAGAHGFFNPKHVGPWYQLSQDEWDRIRSLVDPMNQLEGYEPLPEEVPTQAIRHRG